MATPNGFSSVINACPSLPARLKDAFETGMMAVDNAPLTEFVASAMNRRPITSLILPSDGGIRAVQLRYRRRLLEENVKTNQPNPNCATTDTYGDNVKTYTFNPNLNFQAQDTIKRTDYLFSCDEGMVADRVAALVDVLDRRIATYVSNGVVSMVGNWGAAVPKALSKTDGKVYLNELYTDAFDSNDKPMPRAFPRIKNALTDSGFPSDFFLAGGGTLREMVQLYQAGCCTNDGIDLSEIFAQFGFAAAHDRRVADALSSEDKYIALAPGAVQLLSWNMGMQTPEFGTILNGGMGTNYVTTLLPSPRFAGVAYELNAADNCGTISLSLTGTVQLIGLPDDMYVQPVDSGSGATAGDEFYGVNGVVKGILA